jgi:hypothetical protein
MNVHEPILHKQVELHVSDRELAEFERATKDMTIAEGALGRPDIQAQLRDLIPDIFKDAPRAIDAAKKLNATGRSSRHPDYYLIKGLRFHELSYAPDKDVRGAFVVGLSSFWGNPSLGNYHQPDASFAYRHIKARPLQPGEQESLLNSIREGFPHTDSAFKPHPEPLFALFAVRAARDGGDSLVWNVRAIVDWIASRPTGPEAIDIMTQEAFPFVGSILEPERVVHMPVLMDNSGERMRYKRDAIEDAARALRRDASAKEHLVMDTIDAAARSPELTVRFALRDGDAVIFDNQRTLHSRMPFSDVDRHLLKTTMVD